MLRLKHGQGPKPTAEVFATILLCSSDDSMANAASSTDPTKNKYARGMTMFRDQLYKNRSSRKTYSQ